MTTIIVTTGGDFSFDNKGIKPIEECKRCNSKNLEHDFTAGEMSDEYGGTECLDCEMVCCPSMGGWVAWFSEGEYTIWFRWGYDANHPLNDGNLNGVTLERDGYHPVGGDRKMHLGSVSLSITMAEALALVDNKEELWERNK